MKADSLSYVEEIAPVEGFSTEQRTNGGKLNAIQDKLLAISGELIVGSGAVWNINRNVRLRAFRVSLGISAPGTFTMVVKKNGANITPGLVVNSGVLVQEFQMTNFTSRDFVPNDVLSIIVTSVNGIKSAFHMSAQLDYIEQ